MPNHDAMVCSRSWSVSALARKKSGNARSHLPWCAETDFHHELRPGDVMALEPTVLTLGEKSATFHHRLKNVATGTIAMSTEFKCVLLDLEKRKATLIPDDIRAAATQLMGDVLSAEFDEAHRKKP